MESAVAPNGLPHLAAAPVPVENVDSLKAALIGVIHEEQDAPYGPRYGMSTSWDVAIGQFSLVPPNTNDVESLRQWGHQVLGALVLLTPRHPAVRRLSEIVGSPTMEDLRDAVGRSEYNEMELEQLRTFFDPGWTSSPWSPLIKNSKVGPVDTDGEGPKAPPIADEILSRMHFRTLEDTEELFWYDEGIYRPYGEAKVREIVERMCDNHATARLANEVLFHIRARTYISRMVFTPPPDEVWVENGIYNVLTGDLEPFSPDRPSLGKLPLSHDETADCPAIKKFLSEVLYAEDIPAIQELFGYLLLKDYRYQKAFMFVGEGANGKSSLIALMKAFLGVDNIACVSLQELSENKFAMAALYQKMANLYPDLTAQALKHTGQFKALTGGDAITGEHKYHAPFKFVNFAKMVFSANQLPKVHDQTDAFFRRWVIFTFPNQFVGAKADPNLLAKLTTKAELSGLLTWAVEGLKRLITAGDFSRMRSIDETREIYERMSSPLHAFIMDEIIAETDAWITKDEFYDAFTAYCRDKKLPATSKNVIGRDLAQYVTAKSEHRRVGPGARKHTWVGIRRKTKEEKEEEVRQEAAKDAATEAPLETDGQIALTIIEVPKPSGAQEDRIERLLSALRSYGGTGAGDGADWEMVVRHLVDAGDDEDRVRSDFDSLVRTGRVYSPRQDGRYRVL